MTEITDLDTPTLTDDQKIRRSRVDEYHKNGCNFYGKLVVFHYLENAMKDKEWGKFGANITLDYYSKALALAKELYGENFKVLLSMPELVIRLEWTAEEILQREG